MECFYCKHDMGNDKIRCKHCGGIQYEANKKEYNTEEEKIFFDLDFVRITNKIFISQNQIFSIPSINSIRVDHKERGISKLGWGVIFIAFIFILTFPGWWKLLGAALLIVGAGIPNVHQSLKVKTSNGEQEALVIGDEKIMELIVEGLKEASKYNHRTD